MSKTSRDIVDQIELLQRENKMLLSQHKQNANTISQLKEQLGKMNADKELSVSDHAILRYCERVLGIDIDMISEEILSDNIIDQSRILGEGKFQHPDRYSVVVQGGKVLTLYRNGEEE